LNIIESFPGKIKIDALAIAASFIDWNELA
jgi:hypothetical protein